MLNLIHKDTEHKTKKVLINKHYYNIDEKIVPIIKYLNKLPGITTLFSCQGTILKNGNFDAYISFISKNNQSLYKIEDLFCPRNMLGSYLCLSPTAWQKPKGKKFYWQKRYRLTITNEKVLEYILQRIQFKDFPFPSSWVVTDKL